MRKENLEIWSWTLQRITAIFLIFGMIVHFWVLHYLEIPDKAITFTIVQERLQSPWWIVFDSLLLITALYHALNGIWSIILDWNPGKTVRIFLGWSLSLIGIIGLIIGMLTLFPFAA